MKWEEEHLGGITSGRYLLVGEDTLVRAIVYKLLTGERWTFKYRRLHFDMLIPSGQYFTTHEEAKAVATALVRLR